MGGGRRAGLGLWLLGEGAGLRRWERPRPVRLAQEGKTRGAGPRPEEKRSSTQEGNRRFSDFHFRILDGISKRNSGQI
jgi:hypothetical protein